MKICCDEMQILLFSEKRREKLLTNGRLGSIFAVR